MKIELSKTQYKNLLKLVYLGSWLADSYKTEESSQTQEIRNYIYSFAKEYNLEDLIEFSREHEEFFETRKMDDMFRGDIESYDNHNFWEELAYRMAERDLINQYGIESVEKWDPEERISKEILIENRYREEFEKHGIDRLTISSLRKTEKLGCKTGANLPK